MKRFKFTILSLFIIILFYFYNSFYNQKQGVDTNKKTPTEQVVNFQKNKENQTQTKKDSTSALQSQTKVSSPPMFQQAKPNVQDKIVYAASWNDLKIQPMASPEGVYYTFSAFDFYQNHLFIAGNFSNRNILRIFIDSQPIEIDLEGIPLDILVNQNKIYTLTTKYLYQTDIKGKLMHKYRISDDKIMFFDKLLVFDNVLQILMSDGSAYVLEKGKLNKRKGLKTEKESLLNLIKKGKFSFEISEIPCIDYCKTYPTSTELGSLTFAGGSYHNLYLIIDLLNKKGKYERKLFNNHNNFKQSLLTLPYNQFTYIKNDYKLKNEKILLLKAQKNGIQIIQKTLYR